MKQNTVDIIGAGLAGSEAALQLACRNIHVRLFEMRPDTQTAVHKTDKCAELVCSNSLKSTKPTSAAGMLKQELSALGSQVLACAYEHRVAAGGALAVDRVLFANAVTQRIEAHPNIERVSAEAVGLSCAGAVQVVQEGRVSTPYTPAQAVIVASGPLTSHSFAGYIQTLTGQENLAFFDAAAPVVMADSLNYDKVFCQSRYEQNASGDYLNAPFTKEEYEYFIRELLGATCVIKRSFETSDLFQACQPLEEIARRGFDAPRFGPLKPVGLTDPRTGKRPWAVVQLRAEDAQAQSFNLVGFQTNLTFGEQQRVFRLIPGLEQAEFARYGVMHRNTFINAPALLTPYLQLHTPQAQAVAVPVFVAGQLSGTEGYCEAIASGLYAALNVAALVQGSTPVPLPQDTAFGALIAYATDSKTVGYQPMHVNFGIMSPLSVRIKNKQQRYGAYAARGKEALEAYRACLAARGLI